MIKGGRCLQLRVKSGRAGVGSRRKELPLNIPRRVCPGRGVQQAAGCPHLHFKREGQAEDGGRAEVK
jgi:hypothetical protein